MRRSLQAPWRAPLPAVKSAYTLVELLVVVGVVSLLLALAAPAFVALAPTRKAGIHELAAFLKRARAEARATGRERIVAFADRNFPPGEGALRSYALFADADDVSSGAHAQEENGGAPQQLTPWRRLPTGLIFARGGDFETVEGTAFRTIHDLVPTRSFSISGSGNFATTPLPCLVFGPDGSVRFPGFSDADALHLGLAEGHYEPETKRVVYRSKRPGRSGATLPNAECLEIGFYSGRTRILTD